MVVKNGNEEIETTGKGYNFTFKMPGADITAEHQFKKFEYALSIVTDSNGVIKADKEKYGYQDTVTLSVEPKAGKVMDAIAVKDGETKLELKKEAENKYTFSMPASKNVVVSATYKDAPVKYKVTYADGDYVNIRETAGKSGADLGDIPNGTVLEALEGSTADWVKVQYKDITGWVSMLNLTKVTN